MRYCCAGGSCHGAAEPTVCRCPGVSGWPVGPPPSRPSPFSLPHHLFTTARVWPGTLLPPHVSRHQPRGPWIELVADVTTWPGCGAVRLCWGPGTVPLQLTSWTPPGRVWKWPAARRPLCRVCRAGTCVGRVGVYACSVCAGRHLCLCARVSMRHTRSWVCVHCHVRAPGAGRYSRCSTPHGPRS